jgi:dCMP deaminase
VLYCDTCPCLTCSIKIAQVGISEVVYSQGYSMDTETAAVFKEAGVKLRQFIPVSYHHPLVVLHLLIFLQPPNGMIHLEKQSLY